MPSPAHGPSRRRHDQRPAARRWSWPWLRLALRRLGVRWWGVLLAAAGAVALSLLTGFFGVIGERIFPGLVDRFVPTPEPPPPLSVRVLGPGGFQPTSLTGNEPYLLSDSGTNPSDVPAAAVQDSDAYREWATSHGGQPAGEYALRLDLRAATSEPVIIHGLRVRTVSNAPSASKGWFRDPEAGCGGEPVRFTRVDFDQSGARMTWWDPDEEAAVDPPTLTVTSSDTETIELKVATRVRDVSFQILVLYDAPAGSGELAVGDGRIFVLKALPQGTRFYRADLDRRRLVRDSSADPGPEGWAGGC